MTETTDIHDTPERPDRPERPERPGTSDPTGDALLTVAGLVKTFSGERRRGQLRRRRAGVDDIRVRALDGVSFDIQPGELFTLLGPSGCGKTTTLRSIAGLERPDGGTISVAGSVLFDAARGVSVPSNAR